MATASQADFQCTGTWQDVVATITAAASVDAVYQCADVGGIQVVFGGGTAPTTANGIFLAYLDSVQGNAANVWARALDGNGALTVTVL